MSGERKGRKENWRPTYQWRVQAMLAEEMLKAIVPFLRERKPQADLLLQMRETVSTARLTAEVIAERQLIKQKVKELKYATS